MVRITTCLMLMSIANGGSAFGQNSEAYLRCSRNAHTQSELTACAATEAKKADEELNRVYRALLSSKSQDSVAVEKVRKLQRAWVVYRDACFEAAYPATNKQAEYGSMYPMELALLGAELSRRQIEVLKKLMEQ